MLGFGARARVRAWARARVRAWARVRVRHHLREQADDTLDGARRGGGVGGATEDEGARRPEVCDVVEAPG